MAVVFAMIILNGCSLFDVCNCSLNARAVNFVAIWWCSACVVEHVRGCVFILGCKPPVFRRLKLCYSSGHLAML